jgi:hypothetical protein
MEMWAIHCHDTGVAQHWEELHLMLCQRSNIHQQAVDIIESFAYLKESAQSLLLRVPQSTGSHRVGYETSSSSSKNGYSLPYHPQCHR